MHISLYRVPMFKYMSIRLKIGENMSQSAFRFSRRNAHYGRLAFHTVESVSKASHTWGFSLSHDIMAMHSYKALVLVQSTQHCSNFPTSTNRSLKRTRMYHTHMTRATKPDGDRGGRGGPHQSSWLSTA